MEGIRVLLMGVFGMDGWMCVSQRGSMGEDILLFYIQHAVWCGGVWAFPGKWRAADLEIPISIFFKDMHAMNWNTIRTLLVYYVAKVIRAHV